MKSKYIFITIIVLFFSCKQNTSSNKTIHEENLTKTEQPSNSFIDSLQYFTMSPIYFDLYYSGSKIKVDNKKYMENAIKNSKYYIPELTEKIMDTTKTKVTNSNDSIHYRIGDIALELIDISRKESIQNFILEEFNEKDLKNIQEYTQASIGFDELVYIPLFYSKDDLPKMKNRMRLYQLYKRKLK